MQKALLAQPQVDRYGLSAVHDHCLEAPVAALLAPLELARLSVVALKLCGT